MNEFYTRLAKIINKGQSRSVVLSGNTHDLYFDGSKYVPLVNFLSTKGQVEGVAGRRGITQVVYEINKSIRVVGTTQQTEELIMAWGCASHVPRTSTYLKEFQKRCEESFTNSVVAFELLRQLTIATRNRQTPLLNDLVVIIEGVDFRLPECEISRMLEADRKRLEIMHDWFSDPEFVSGNNSVILIAESRSLIHSQVSKLPQVLSVEIPYPDFETRQHFIQLKAGDRYPNLAKQTAGLSIHALRQLLCDDEISRVQVNNKVEEFICGQLGEDVIEFKRPQHTLKDVMGFASVKNFITSELIPRFQATDDSALPGAAVAGPIGGGKTYIFEAVAAELDMPVLVLKNMRSQWYGQTDVIFERLRRTLIALDKVMIFVDEADTQFGSVGSDSHETERRLTGKIQAMMSDSKLRGKVVWLLMTARIDRLSPDIRRPGRVGDLIIPILDPDAEDRTQFINWVVGRKTATPPDYEDMLTAEEYLQLDAVTQGYSAASFSSLRSRIKAEKCQTIQEMICLAEDILPGDIAEARRFQTLQALLNCTRKSLIKNQVDETLGYKKTREKWQKELQELQRKLG